MFNLLTHFFLFAIFVRADKEKFTFLCSDGYRVLKAHPVGQPKTAPSNEVDVKDKAKYLALKAKYQEFVSQPDGPLWR